MTERQPVKTIIYLLVDLMPYYISIATFQGLILVHLTDKNSLALGLALTCILSLIGNIVNIVG